MNWSSIIFSAAPLAALLISMPSDASNHNWGRGKVSVQGSIIDAACAIATDSRDQTLAVGTHPTSGLRRGQEISKELKIELINCIQKHPDPSHPDNTQFRITFDGKVDGGLFGIGGDARGMGIEIRDDNGYVARPGEALPPVKITPGGMTLNYKVKLVRNSQKIVPGNYHSAIRFKMDYF